MHKITSTALAAALALCVALGFTAGLAVATAMDAESCRNSGAFHFDGKDYFCGEMPRGKYVY